MKTRDIDFGERRNANLQPEEELSAEEGRALRDHLTGFRFFHEKLLLFYKKDDHEASVTLSAKTRLAQEMLQEFEQDSNRSVISLRDVSKNNVLIEIRTFTEQKEYAAAPLSISLDEDFRLEAMNVVNLDSRNPVKFMTEEFVCEGRIFVQPMKKDDVHGRLLGRRYICEVTYDPKTATVRALRLKRKFRQQVEHISAIRMVTGKIAFVDGTAALRNEARALYEANHDVNQEFEDIWNAYNDAEKAGAIDETNELGAIAYRVVKEMPRIQLRLAREMTSSKDIFLQSSQGYAVCAKTSFDDVRRTLERKATAEKNKTENNLDEKTDDTKNQLAKEDTDVTTVEILDALSRERKPIVFLSNEVSWNAKDKLLTVVLDRSMEPPQIPRAGYIFASYGGSRIMIDRRTRAYDDIQAEHAAMPGLRNIIGSGQPLDREGVKRKKVVNRNLLKKIFGTTSTHFTEKQMEAIDIAINTPDIAIIQGPPGTGKTTIIRAIVERLHELHSDDLRILISSTQHEAVDNAIRGMTHCGMPPIRIQNGRGKAVRGDQQNKAAWLAGLTEACDAILKKAPENKNLLRHRHVYQLLESIRREGVVNLEACEEEIKELQHEMQSLGYDESIIDRIHALQERFIEVRHGAEDSAEDDDRLASLLSAQCRTPEEFLQQGPKELIRLQTYLQFLDESQQAQMEPLIKSDWMPLRCVRGKKHPDDFQEKFAAFRADIDRMVAAVTGPSEDPAVQELSRTLARVLDEVKSYVDSLAGKQRTVYDVLWEFRDAIGNPSCIEQVLAKYSKVKAATCQQAALHFSKRGGFLEQSSDVTYHYVIIDEAARSNPLDLLIPMARGQRIILVGDQNQLPHMLEPEVTEKVLDLYDPGERKHKESLLRESLFQRLYRQLQDQNGVRRVTMLEDQYRMHPVIGDFVSSCFYDGKLRSKATAEAKAHNLGLFDDKPVAWIDVPARAGEEKKAGTSRKRPAEVDRVIETVQRIYEQTPKFSIGIITFYLAQANEIGARLKSFPMEFQQCVECGTVDAFQGKEFDVVILSTVRSNAYLNHRRRVGFLDNPNRLCVAFSRAKRLLIVIGDAETVAGSATQPVIPSFESFYELCQKEGYHE